jgi:serine/threonine protein kinase
MKGLEGTTLGRYELRHCVARGGTSEVYLGYDRYVRRKIAIKVLYGSNEHFVRRFEREALAIGALSHDHILPLYDFGQQRPWYYLVMPYVAGGTLREYLLTKPWLSLEEAGHFLEQIASALQHAHDHGVIHRDVKPSNILLRPDGHVYLADFGLAKAKLEAESYHHGGNAVGTPEYMAPEQSNGISDYRSDIYSLGIILYQMLTGQVPFSADSPVAVTLKHLQTQPQPPGQINSQIPHSIEEVMLKALAKDPDERYQQARAFSLAYKKALRQERHQKWSLQPSTPGASSQPKIPSTNAEQDILTSVTKPIIIPQDKAFAPSAVLPRSRELLFMSSIPATPRLRQRLHQALIIILCLTLLGSSLLLSLLWQNYALQPPRPTEETTFQAQQFNITATARAHIQQQATLAAQARVQATAGITTGIRTGKVLFFDSMTREGQGWINDGSQCYFSALGYHVYTRSAHTVAWCYSGQRSFANVVITAQAQLVHGDMYGLIFRLSSRSKAFYALELNRYGEYRFIRAQGNNPLNWLTLIDWTYSSAIQSGYRHTNTFLIITQGAHFRFYINQQLIVADISDTAYTDGLLGFLAGGDYNYGTDAIFSNLWVFQKQNGTL